MSGSASEDFGRHRRIVKTDEFSSVFRLRPAHRTDHFVLYMRTNTLGHPRLGVVVAKRLAPRAVTRNLIKRLAREVFRRSAARLPNPADCIVRLHRPIAPRRQAASSRALRRLLGAELDRLMHLPSSPR